MAWLKKLLKYTLIAFAIVFSAPLLYLGYNFATAELNDYQFYKKAPITKGGRDDEAVFKTRVQTLFPDGMIEADMVATLQEQGFHPTKPEETNNTPNVTQKGMLLSGPTRGACSVIWFITWDAHQDGTVSAASGRVVPLCY